MANIYDEMEKEAAARSSFKRNIYDEMEKEAAARASSKRNIYDQMEDGTFEDEKPSSLGAFAREAARSVAPGLAGTLAGAASASLAVAKSSPRLAMVAGPIAAITGGMAAGMGTRAAQDAVADKVAPESIMGTKSAQEDYEASPVSSFVGSLLATGKPSISMVKGTLRGLGTAEGRAGLTQVAKSMVNKDARTALTQATDEVDSVTGQMTPKAVSTRQSMDDFGNVIGSAAGFGTQAGMGIAQGQDPLTASAMGLAGLAVKPWVGPGGVFLNGQKNRPSSLSQDPEVPVAPEDLPTDTPPTAEEQQTIDDAVQGKVRSVEATDKAAAVAEATGILPQTAAALRQQSQQIARKPATPPIDPAIETAPAPTPAPAPVGPKITAAAQALANKFGVDILQVKPNAQNNVTQQEVNKWRKGNISQAQPAAKNDNLDQRNWMLGRSKEIARGKDQPYTNFSEWAAANPEDFNQMAVEWRAIKEGTNVEAPAPKAVAPKAPPANSETVAPAARPVRSGDPTRVPDELLLAGVEQAKTKEEFVTWARANGYGETIRPASGGQIGAEAYWSINQRTAAPAAAAPVVAPRAVVPKVVAPAPEVVAPAPEVVPPVPEVVPPVAEVVPPVPEVVAPEVERPAVLEGEPTPLDDRPPTPEDVDTSLEVFPMQGDRQFPDVEVQQISNVPIGLALTPYKQRRFSTSEEAESSLKDFDRVDVKTYFDRVHELLGAGVADSAMVRANTRISLSDALVNLSDGFAPQTLSRYSGASSMNWMKTIEALKAVKSNSPAEIFRQRSGGPAVLLEIATDNSKFGYINLRLREAGIKGATLIRNPETNGIQVYVLVKNPSQVSTALTALKRFSHENNYGKIKSYRGDAESVGADREQATAFLRESLGQYRSGGDGDPAGGPDRVRVADELWGLAQEAGIDLGPRPPEYVEPQKRGTGLLQYEKSLAELKEAFDQIPPEKQEQFGQLFTRAYDRLALSLGQGRMRLQEVGSLLEGDGRSGNEVFETYAKRLRELYSESALVPDLAQRRNNRDKPTDYGVSYAERGNAFPKYNGYSQSTKDQLLQISFGKILEDLAKRVGDAPLPARKTKSTLAKLAAIDKRIEKIRSDSTRSKKLSKGQEAELKKLGEEREKAANQQNPWDMEAKVFNRYVEGKLDNSVKSMRTVEKNRAEVGLKEVEDTVLGPGDDKESVSLIDKAAAEDGEDAVVAVSSEDKRAAYEAIRDPDVRLPDKVAIAMKLQGGILNKRELKSLEADFVRVDRELLKSENAPRNQGLAGIPRVSLRQRGRDIADSYTLEQILRGEHRNADGGVLLSPTGEGLSVGREAPPQVLEEYTARTYLQQLLDSKSISSEESALVRKLVKEANLDNIPLRVYDYLDGAYGSYDPTTGEVALSFETSSPDRNVETGLHEVGHALLGYFLNPRNVASLNSRQKKLVGDLNNFFKQTTEAAIRGKKFTREQLDAVRSMKERGDVRLSSTSDRAAYRYSDVDEWTAAMMSNPDFRDYMKTLRTRDTVTGKMRQAWETFKDLVARLFGVDRSVYRKSFDKIMELTVDPEAGRLPGETDAGNTLKLSPIDESSPRFTSKVSTAKENEPLAPDDKVSFKAQQVPQARLKAMEYKSNGGTLEALMDGTAPLLGPERLQAAALFRDEAQTARALLEKKTVLTAKEIRERRAYADQEVLARQYLVGQIGPAAQLMAHGQHLDNRASVSIDGVIDTLVGKENMKSLEGKIDLQRMMSGIRDIKAKAADITMSAMSIELERVGITRAEDLQMLQETLAHTSTTFKDLVISLASVMPAGSPAQTRAMAERIYRLYSAAGNSVSKSELPTIVRDTYNGESTVPAGDQFLQKLNEFIKIGKYSEDSINATLLESLGLSGYDKDFIAGIRKDLDKVAAMPEGDMRNAASVAVLQKVRTKLYNNVLKTPLFFGKDSKAARGHVMDMITSAWQSGVLSGPPTGFVNLLGSHASIWAESMMEATGYSLKTGDPRYIADVVGGFLSALLGNKSTGRGSAATAEAYAAMLGRGTKYRNAMKEEMPHLENVDITGTNLPVKMIAGYAKNLRWVGRTMTAVDAINMSMADEAKQRLVTRYFLSETKGHRASEVADMMHKLFDPDIITTTNARKQAEDDVKTFMSDKSVREQKRWVTRRTLEILTQKREELMPGIAEAGKGAAERFTYNETAKGILGKFIVNFSAQVNEKIKAGRFILSFMNTLANIMNQTLDYTPYGLLRAKNWSVGQKTIEADNKYRPRHYTEGSPEQMAQIARANIGTAVIMTLGYLAYKGYESEQNGEIPYFTVTGSGPKNPFDRQQLVDSGGWKPNSVKIGDTWYRYIDFPILGPTLGGVGTMMDAARYRKDAQSDTEVVMNAALAAATTVMDKQLLQGVNNFMKMLQGGQPGQQVYSAKRIISGVVGGFTNPSMARWMRNTFYTDSEGMVDRLDQSTTSGWIASMIPFSIGYSTAALNTLGEPIQQPWYSATTWRFADLNKAKPHPIITPLVKAGLMLPNPSPNTQFELLDPEEGQIIITKLGKYPNAMRRFVELRGQALKRILTPEYIVSLQAAARQNQETTQDHLDNDVGKAAREYAVQQVQQEIREGKLKL